MAPSRAEKLFQMPPASKHRDWYQTVSLRIIQWFLINCISGYAKPLARKKLKQYWERYHQSHGNILFSLVGITLKTGKMRLILISSLDFWRKNYEKLSDCTGCIKNRPLLEILSVRWDKSHWSCGWKSHRRRLARPLCSKSCASGGNKGGEA